MYSMQIVGSYWNLYFSECLPPEMCRTSSTVEVTEHYKNIMSSGILRLALSFRESNDTATSAGPFLRETLNLSFLEEQI